MVKFLRWEECPPSWAVWRVFFARQERVRPKPFSAKRTLPRLLFKKARTDADSTCDDPAARGRFCRGREDCFLASALRDAARREPWAYCRDGAASHAFPVWGPGPCSRRDGAQGYARRAEARAQACAPLDAGPEARGARHAARARDDSPHRPESPAAAECIRQEEKDNRWQRAELS